MVLAMFRVDVYSSTEVLNLPSERLQLDARLAALGKVKLDSQKENHSRELFHT